MVAGFVVPDCCGEGEESLKDTGANAGSGAAAVSFEVELGFEGLVDRFDDLAEGPEEPLVWPWLVVAEGRADEGDASGVEFGLELGAPVALVGHEDLTWAL